MPREPALGGAPGWEGSCSSLQPPTEASSCTGSPKAPQKITAHGCAPAPQPRGGGGGAHPNSLGSPGQDADEHPAPSQRGQGGWVFPKTGSQPHCRQVRLPAGKGRAQPCRKPRKLPFPREAAGQYDSKSYFTVAKERHVSRLSQRGSVAGSWLQVPGTVRPEPPALPKTLTHLLPPGDPGPRPSTDLLPHRRILLTLVRHWVGARALSRPLCRIQNWISLPMPPKPDLEQSKRRYCWFFFPWPPCLQPLDSGPAALRDEGCSCCPHSAG